MDWEVERMEDRILNAHEALKILKSHYITDNIQMVSRYIREGRLYAERASRKDGYKIKESDLYRFIEDERPMLPSIIYIYNQYVDGELIPKTLGTSCDLSKTNIIHSEESKMEPPCPNEENGNKVSFGNDLPLGMFKESIRDLHEQLTMSILASNKIIVESLSDLMSNLLEGYFLKATEVNNSSLQGYIEEWKQSNHVDYYKVENNTKDKLEKEKTKAVSEKNTEISTKNKYPKTEKKKVHESKTYKEFVDMLLTRMKLINLDETHQFENELKAIYQTYYDENGKMRSVIKYGDKFKCPENEKVNTRFYNLVSSNFEELFEKAKNEKLKIQQESMKMDQLEFTDGELATETIK